MRKVIKYKTYNCRLSREKFSNGVSCIVLSDIVDGQSVAKASVNLPCYTIGPNQTFIKDKRENEGMLQTLIDNGIVIIPETPLKDEEGTLVDIIEDSLMV